MHRRTSRRQLPSRGRARPSKFPAGPIVAFLLVASFGILFAGCSKQKLAIKGPADVEEVTDVTFTQEDLEKFSQLSTSSQKGTVTTLSAEGTPETTGEAVSSAEGTLVLSVESATGAALPTTPVALDLSLANTYDVLRQNKGGNEPNVYKVYNSFVNIRSGPSSQSALVARLNDGESVTLIEFVNSEWAKVKLANGAQGYTVNRYLARFTTSEKLAAEKKAFENMYYVSFAFVNVRSSPDQKGEKLGQIPGKQFVQPISIANGWAKVQFQGKEGYVSMQYLAKFTPQFLTAQNTYALPIFVFDAGDPSVINTLNTITKALRDKGTKLVTLRDFRQILLDQQRRDFLYEGRNAVIAITGLNKTNALTVADALTTARIPATFFIQTKDVGIAGMTQKTLQRLSANGFDVQSAGHTGEDLRALTSAQVKLEVEQSRKILEDAVKRPVFAIAYPMGGVNDRTEQLTDAAGYLFGIASSPETVFTREQLLRLPSFLVTSSMKPEDVVSVVK